MLKMAAVHHLEIQKNGTSCYLADTNSALLYKI